jgi:hypothetical protein
VTGRKNQNSQMQRRSRSRSRSESRSRSPSPNCRSFAQDEEDSEDDCYCAETRFDAKAFGTRSDREQCEELVAIHRRNRAKEMKLSVKQAELLALRFRLMRKRRQALRSELAQPIIMQADVAALPPPPLGENGRVYPAQYPHHLQQQQHQQHQRVAEEDPLAWARRRSLSPARQPLARSMRRERGGRNKRKRDSIDALSREQQERLDAARARNNNSKAQIVQPGEKINISLTTTATTQQASEGKRTVRLSSPPPPAPTVRPNNQQQQQQQQQVERRVISGAQRKEKKQQQQPHRDEDEPCYSSPSEDGEEASESVK